MVEKARKIILIFREASSAAQMRFFCPTLFSYCCFENPLSIKHSFLFGSNGQINTLHAKTYSQFAKKENLFGEIANHLSYMMFDDLISVFEEIWEKCLEKLGDRQTGFSRIKKLILHKSHCYQSNEKSNFNPLQFLRECHFHNSELGNQGVIVHLTSNSKKNEYSNY